MISENSAEGPSGRPILPQKRTLKLVVEYDGSRYKGWQVQAGAPTLQGQIEKCLERILGLAHRIQGAGRTDAGVHARGQVAHFVTDHPLASDVLQRALNATLPRDISILSVQDVSWGFHARTDALGKRYEYQILNRQYRSALLDNFVWHIRHPLDFGAMERVGQILVGTHDFRAFCATDSQITNHVRTIEQIDFLEVGDGLWRIGVEGSGFLRHMVRVIVGTLVEVGIGKCSREGFEQILKDRDRRAAGRTAPAQGLCLCWVRYTSVQE